MHFPRAAFGLAIATAPLGVLSQVVTITQRPSACSAIYTTGSSSVTVVQSTVTVAPIQFTDALVNGGTPFVIEVQPGTAARRRQAESSTYIDVDGRTTTNASEAAMYKIINGTLQGVKGGYVSTDTAANSASFALSDVVKAISTTFFSRNLQVGWNNTAFSGGSCDFYTTPAGDGTLQVISYFKGIVDASWLAVTFAVKSIGDLDLDPTTSTTVSTVISMGGGVTATPAEITSTTVVPIPTPSGDPTENGYCGAAAGICDGVVFGTCCSQYGACGNTDEYCGAGCQSSFGSCSPVAASSSVAAGVSSAGPSVGPSAPIYSATAPQPATSSPAVSSIAPVFTPTVYQSTSVFVSTSGSVTLTMTTMVAVSTSLPIYSVPGTPIGPINPPVVSSSAAAPSSAAAISSQVLPPSYPATPSPSAAATSAGISSIIPSSAVGSISVPGVPSVAPSSARTTPAVSSSVPGSVAPPSSSPIAGISSPVVSIRTSAPVVASSSSVVIPLPSFYSSPPASVVPTVSSAVIPPVSSAVIPPISSAVVPPASSAIVPPVSSAVIPPVSSTRVASSSIVFASPVASSCPGAADGSSATDSNGQPYTIYCNSDYSGNLAQFPDTASFDACLALCDKTAGCGAATWIPSNTYCYLKPTGGYVTGSGGYVGVRVNPAVGGSSSTMAVIVSTSSGVAITSTTVISVSVPALPTEQSFPPVYTMTPIAASSTALPTEVAPVYSETPSIAPVFSSTPIPDTYPSTTLVEDPPTSSAIPPIFSSTPMPDPVFSSTPVPDTYPTTTSADAAPTSTSPLVLTAPVRCDFGDPVGYGEDDSYCQVTLPQPMFIYTKSSVNTYASTNGFLSILSGATQYQNAPTLPTTQLTEADNTTPLSAVLPFWDDLAIPEGESDYGIYYQLSDTGVTYEFYLTRTGQVVLFHFTVQYTYSNPGVFSFTYYQMDDPGDHSTVGSQGFDATGTAVGRVYSYQTGGITTGLVVICDTNANTCVAAPSTA